MPCSVFVKGLFARFVMVNRTMLDRFGFDSNDEIVGLDDFDLHPAEHAEIYAAIDHQVMSTGVPVIDLEEAQTTRDGSPMLVRTSKFPVRNRAGEVVGLMGFSVDVTEPARVSAALADSEERYALAARATRDGIWDYDVATDSITLSPRCAQIFDLPITGGALAWETLADRIGRTQTRRLVSASIRAMKSPSESLSLDVDLQLNDGSTRVINVVGTVVDLDGRATRVVGSAEDVTVERARQVELKHQANHDDLTGLQNRRALLDALETATGSLLYLDLDSFKVVNDSLGHHAGDDMLVSVASRLDAILDDDCSLYRLGGDEFAILLDEGCTDRAFDLAQRINEALRQPFLLAGLEIYTTVSVGIVADIGDGQDPAGLLRDADIALYEAKAAGKARAIVFEPAMLQRAEDALNLQMHIRRAVEQSEFELHYQPICDAASGLMTGVEALLRWRRADGRCEPPSVFLPYLEETKLIVAAGRWVIEEACAQMAVWRREHPSMSDIELALNVSRVQFDSPDLVETIESALVRNALDPAGIVIEITETAVTERTSELRTRLDTLRALGLRVAIDDFGVGQSSLSALYDIPADILKIDRSFIERIDQGIEEPVTNAVIAIATSLGMTTVAEGVETESQAAWLVDHRCERLQGYLLSRPVPAVDVPAVATAFSTRRSLV